MPKDLTAALSIGQVDDDELVTLVSWSFPRGYGTEDHIEVRSENDQCAITFSYKDRVLIGATRGPALSEGQLKELQTRIESALLESKGHKVARSIAFSLERVRGWWRYMDEVQVLPPPSQAPDPDESYAEHPFVIEVCYPASDDRHVALLRELRATQDIRLLLHLVLNGRVTWPRGNAYKRWMYVGGTEDFHSEWLQEGYDVPSFNRISDDFSDISEFDPIATTKDSDYFARQAVSSEPLRVPDGLETYVRAFFELTKLDRDRFLRACFWYNAADQSWELGHSLHYNCLIGSVEALMDTAPTDPCSKCGRDRAPGPTARFREFIERYAPGTTAQDRSEFYRLRSALSHGHKLLRRDLNPSWGTLHPTEIEERDIASRVRQVARISLINWLANRQPPHD